MAAAGPAAPSGGTVDASFDDLWDSIMEEADDDDFRGQGREQARSRLGPAWAGDLTIEGLGLPESQR